jgi:DNA-binding LacI/PurR family transcriptional regulator
MTNIAEVAKRAGVSPSTVSHAISGKRPISAEVKRRIFAIMEELNYHPNRLASALKAKQSKMIAFLYPTVNETNKRLSQPQLEFVSSAVEAASEHGYALTLWTSPVDELELTRFMDIGIFDGVVVMEVKIHDPRLPFLERYRFPFSLIGRCEDNTGLTYVDFDFEKAMLISVEHLYKLGHTNILFLAESPSLLKAEYGPAVRTRLGFEEALQHYHINGRIFPCEPDARVSYALVQQVFQTDPQPTAIITMNPWVALGTIQALNDNHIHIPEDISLLSIIASHFSEMMSPPLTGIDIPINEMGKMGVELLIQNLEDLVTEPIQRLLSPTLTIRKSTAPPHSEK